MLSGPIRGSIFFLVSMAEFRQKGKAFLAKRGEITDPSDPGTGNRRFRGYRRCRRCRKNPRLRKLQALRRWRFSSTLAARVCVWEAENISSSGSVTVVTNLGGPVFWSQQLLLRLFSLWEVLFPCSISAQFSTLGGLSAAAAPARSGYSAFGAAALRVPVVAPQYASRSVGSLASSVCPLCGAGYIFFHGCHKPGNLTGRIMQHAAGTMGLQSLKHLGQLLPFDAQDGASCFRHICLPPISAITVSIGDAAAVKKKVALQANKGLRPLEPIALKDHRTTRGALTLIHENISVGPHGNSAQLEEDSADSSMVLEMFPDHDARSLLERAILEVQWALSLEEILLSNETTSQLKQRRKPKLKVKKAMEEEEESSPGSEASLSVKEPALVSSGRPSARSRRLEARKQRLATSGPPTPPEVLMIWPLKKYEKGGRVKHVKPEALQDYLTTYMRDITKIDMLTRDEEIVLSKKMQIGLKLRDSKKRLAVELGYEPSKKEWAEYLRMPIGELVRKLEEAEFARDKMVMANLRLVVSVAKRYHSYGLEMADLIQEGSIGLLRGVEKFDHTRGYKLSTYVHWWIRQGVTRAIADHSRTVRVPVHVHDTLGRIRKAKSKLLAEGSRASIQDLSEATSLSGTKVKNALKVTKKLVSLDMEMGRNSLQRGDGETLHGLVGDQDGRSQPWKVVERMMMKVDVDRLLNSELGPRERDIVRLHYGVGCQDGNPLSLESISHRYGVSRERVRQLETAAMRKLQIASTEHGLDCYRQSLL